MRDKTLSIQKKHEIRQNKTNKIIYDKLKEQYPYSINIINLLSLAQQGLTYFDLVRISLINDNLESSDMKVNLGDWSSFLKRQFQQ